MTVTLLVTDQDLVPQGDPITNWLSVQATAQFNVAGAGTVVLPSSPDLIEQVTGNRARMVVVRDGSVFMGGPIEKPGPYDWSAKRGDAGAPPGQLQISFTDDFAMIAEEITYADPAHASTAQTLTTFVRTGVNAETVIRDLVNLNVGPGAIAARQIPSLLLASAASVGSNVDLTTRFEPLADVIRAMALAGGGLGVRTRQSGSDILFEVYAPVDRSGPVRFSPEIGNLISVHLDAEKPTCTVAIVEGGIVSGSRVVRERTNPAAITRWGRVVLYVNRQDTTSNTELDQAGDQALAEGGERAQVSFVALDGGDQVYDIDYRLGDVVTVAPYPGLEITEVVRAVTLSADPKAGEVVTPLLGSDSAITDSKVITQLKALERRLGRVERSA